MSRKNKQYTREMLDQAVAEVKAGASLRATSKKYIIPHTTLQDYKKRKYALDPHPNSALIPEEEDVLISFIFWIVDHGFPVTRSLLKVLAIGIIKESGRTQSTLVNLEKGPSDVWWSRFKARHPELTSRMAHSLDRARVHGATPEAIEGFFRLYEALYLQHSLEDKPHLIYSCDETGFGDKPQSREKALCQTGRKHVYQQQQQTTREHIMVHCCVNAAGESIPPFIIYPCCLPSNASRLDGTLKGYMDSKLFLKWLRHFVKYAPEERPLILIMDQHETRVSKDVIVYCRENKIEILCLPAHTTHILQPLDIAVFSPLKTAFSTMASRTGLVRGDLVVGKKQFSSLLKYVYPTAVTAQNIKAGFRKAGIFPLSREAVDTTQVVLRVLPSAHSDATPSNAPAIPSATTSSTPPTHTNPSATPSATPTPCPTCKKVCEAKPDSDAEEVKEVESVPHAVAEMCLLTGLRWLEQQPDASPQHRRILRELHSQASRKREMKLSPPVDSSAVYAGGNLSKRTCPELVVQTETELGREGLDKHGTTPKLNRVEDLVKVEDADDMKLTDSVKLAFGNFLSPDRIGAVPVSGGRVKAERDSESADFNCTNSRSDKLKCEPTEISISDRTSTDECSW